MRFKWREQYKLRGSRTVPREAGGETPRPTRHFLVILFDILMFCKIVLFKSFGGYK
jgi:hypothetical protein